MATKDQLLETLASLNAPISQAGLAELLKQPQGNFKTQLDRFSKGGLILANELKEWVITDAGREELEKLKKEKLPAEPSQEMADMSPYIQFIAAGKAVGVTGTEDFFKAITDYVFTAGDYKDVEWVQGALSGMSIRADLVERWVRVWSAKTFVNRSISPDIERKIKESKKTPEQVKKEEEDNARDYDLDEDDKPVKIGADAGTMTYKDAMELSKVRGMARARAGRTGGAGGNGNKSVSEQITEMVAAVDQLRGNQAPPKNYMVKPGPDGGWVIEEVEQGKPMIIPQPGASSKKEVWVIQNGQMTKLEDGQPIMLTPPAAAPQPVKTIMVDADGKQTEVAPGQPIIIVKREPAPASALPATADNLAASVLLERPDGTQQRITSEKQLDLVIKLEEWKEDRRRKEESHQNSMEMTKTFKELLTKASRAVERTVASSGGGPA